MHPAVIVGTAGMYLFVSFVCGCMGQLELHPILLVPQQIGASCASCSSWAVLRRSRPGTCSPDGGAQPVATLGNQIADPPLIKRGLVELDPCPLLRKIDIGADDPGLRPKRFRDVLGAARTSQIEDGEL